MFPIRREKESKGGRREILKKEGRKEKIEDKE